MESISDDEIFEVESILGQRKRKGVLEYLVNWKGAAEDTWEPAKTIAVDCAQAVQSFIQSQKTQKARSKSRSKSRSRSSSRSRKATPTRKSSRSRSRGRASKTSSATSTPQEEESTAVRRSVRQLKAAAASSPEPKEETKEEVKVIETQVIETQVISQQSVSVTSNNTSMAEKSEEPLRRSLRSSTMEKRDKLEVQRVHNEQRPTRDDDTKPRSPIWKIADYIVIVLFIVSMCAAIFLFLEKFLDLENFKKQAFPNFGVLKGRLAGAQVRVVELGHSVMGYLSDTWLQAVDFITLSKAAEGTQGKPVPK